MKSSTRLDSVVFQLTPTRTRCDLVILANGKTEKLASGLLNPFLAHLKIAQDQMAKGGYSIILQQEPGTEASWFTKGTVERFVRFVSTPEILERVDTLESEILQIEEQIAIQSNNNKGLSAVEDHQAKPSESKEGSKLMPDAGEEKAIVLYSPSAQPPEANKTVAQEDNSKVQLLKVLETRKTVLQKEQGMAFARAVAAGFDIDDMSPLKSFAETFGATRLMDACAKFTELWRRKHETGQWLEIEAAEAMSARSDFSAMNTSGIVLVNKQKDLKEPWHESSENNGKVNMDISTDEKPSMNQQPSVPQGYFQGQFPHPMYPPWPMHSQPGPVPGFQGYPIQGMPYYQNYPGNGPYFQQPYPSMEDLRHNAGRMGHKRHSLDSRDSHNGSETWEIEKVRTQDDLELENESAQSEEQRNRSSRSGKRNSGRMVIKNINYFTSNRQQSSGSDSESCSGSETGEEGRDLSLGSPKRKHKNSHRSSERKGKQGKSFDASNSSDKEERVNRREVDGGQWQAFQNYLLRDAEEEENTANQDMFSMEKEVRMKRKTNMVGEDPLASNGRRKGQSEAGDMSDMHKMSASMTRLPKVSQDESLISRRADRAGDGSTSMDDLHSSEINGRRRYRGALNDDFIIDGRKNQTDVPTSPSDPMAVSGFERSSNSLERISSSHNIDDDSYIVPFRSISIAEVGTDNRNAMDIDSEIPSSYKNVKDVPNSRVNYEPEDLTLMPARGTEKGSSAYDPALDYEMQRHTEDKKNKDAMRDGKRASKKLDKDQKLKATPNSSDKKVGGPIRKGKPSKLSPLDDARARADKLRTFKADLQKMKKEQEEAERRRLEALKIERQKRIAARGSSIPAQSPVPTLQTRKQLPTKVSPTSHKGSKFSDSEPGLSSPLQRSKVRTASLGSADSQKASKSSKLNGSQSSANRLTRSVSSLPEPKKEDSNVTPDKKASMARIRRLSEPKTSSSPHVPSVKAKSAEPSLKAKASGGPESKKITEIMNHDKSKIASLPELKIKTSKAPEAPRNKAVVNEMVHKEGDGKSLVAEAAEPIKNKDKASFQSDVDDSTVIEKNVLILENEKPSIPPLNLKGTNGEEKKQYYAYKKDKETEIASDYAAIRAPVSSMDMDQLDKERKKHQTQQQPHVYKVERASLNNTRNNLSNLSSASVDEKPYQAPYARVSSLEDPCTGKSEYGRAPPTSIQAAATDTETIKANLSDVRSLKLEKIPEAAAKLQIKESSKGLRKLLKFGRKNHGSSANDSNIEPDYASVNGSETEEPLTNPATSTEVHMLKNLISQDEASSAGTTPQKSSRHFSLFSPFRNKAAGEKKPTTS